MLTVGSKVVLVTGGAQGIGHATAANLARHGAKVVVSDIDPARGSETVARISAAGDEAIFLEHDVTLEGDWKRVVAETLSRFGRLDALFNNAGVYVIAELAETTVEAWNRLMAVNVTGTFLGMKHGSAAMMQSGGGSIVNASSIAAMSGSPGHVLYGASKGAIRAMSKDAAAELGAANIRVNSIHPGYTTTAMADYGAEIAGRTIQELGREASVLGRLASPDDIAHLVMYLISDEAAYITGSEVVIDGGALSRIKV